MEKIDFLSGLNLQRESTLTRKNKKLQIKVEILRDFENPWRKSIVIARLTPLSDPDYIDRDLMQSSRSVANIRIETPFETTE